MTTLKGNWGKGAIALISLLGMGNVFFVSRLVDKMDSMDTSIQMLTTKVAVLEATLARKSFSLESQAPCLTCPENHQGG